MSDINDMHGMGDMAEPQPLQSEWRRFDPAQEAGMDAIVPSPCISVCVMNPGTGWCDGCQRTLEEIALWSSAGNEAKRAVWEKIEQRRTQLGKALLPTSGHQRLEPT